jgi:hypothetical protein
VACAATAPLGAIISSVPADRSSPKLPPEELPDGEADGPPDLVPLAPGLCPPDDGDAPHDTAMTLTIARTTTARIGGVNSIAAKGR